MPLIPFPSVPNVPGVPNVARSGLQSALTAGALLGAQNLLALLDKKWSIVSESGAVALEPDSVLGLEYKGESKVSTYPVEKGSFFAYNKVQMPSDLRIVMTCSGVPKISGLTGIGVPGSSGRSEFLKKLEAMKNSLDLFSIVTPDAVYKSLNLVQYDYRRESRSGVSLLIVDAAFTEIRVSAGATYTTTAQPSGSPSVSNGAVNPVELGSAQASAATLDPPK